MRVYYLTSSQFAISNIALRRLKVSRFSDLNDPFELLGLNLENPLVRRTVAKSRDRINTELGLICFSRSWGNPVLWSHYGDKHSGICLGFDVPDEQLEAVKYQKALYRNPLNKPEVDQVDVDSLMLRLRCTKFKDWAYEKEVRHFVELPKAKVEGGLYFKAFSENLVLREVILGPRCEMPGNSIVDLVAQYLTKVDVVKARMGLSRFEVLLGRRYLSTKDLDLQASMAPVRIDRRPLTKS